MSNEVIWYDSSETGAPVLNNTAGAMLAVLDACLIDGFNVKSVTSIVVASNVATVTCTGHGYSNAYGKLVKISGATPAGLNGRKQPTVTGANTFTFPTSGISDQTATGSISARRAPLETWEKPYSGTNKAMYRSTDTGASGALLRIEDTMSSPASAIAARVRMVESATGIDSYTSPCPSVAQHADGGRWYRGTDSAGAKGWRVIGDGRFFWFIPQLSALTRYGVVCFGDYASHKAGDSTNCMLGYSNGEPIENITVGSYVPVPNAITQASNTAEYPSLLRGTNGVSVAVPASFVPNLNGVPTPPGRSGPAYPSLVDGGMLIAYPTILMETGQLMRGEVPGIGYPAANIVSLPDLTIVGALNNSARTFIAMTCDFPTGEGALVFDLTGPWR